MLNVLQYFRPAPHIAPLSQEKIQTNYKKFRWQVFAGLFIGYAGCCLLRNNFSLAIPYLVEQHGFSKAYLGSVFAALPLGYGLSKFFMAMISDRSNPRYFIATGLVLAAIFNALCGVKLAFDSFLLMFTLIFLDGWFQGMVWPASGRAMAHWFVKRERGTVMSVWNIAHNIGSGGVALLVTLGIAMFSAWHYGVFYMPSVLCLLAAVVVLFTVRDTPQSVGLPPIEEHKGEITSKSKLHKAEKELTTKEILFKYVLVNKYLWFLALANIFVYLVRFGAHNWAPLYLTQVKGFTHEDSRLAFMLYECAAVPGTLLCGWFSDKIGSRRAPVCIACMIATAIAVIFYWATPVGAKMHNNITLMAIGFFIHAPMMLIGVHALDLAHKKAAGTSAGLTGLFGYVGGTTLADAGFGYVANYYGWNGGFVMLLVSCLLAIFFLALTWNAGTAKVSAKEEQSVEDLYQPQPLPLVEPE